MCSHMKREGESMSKWISVRERMPEEGVDVLIYGDIYFDRKGIDVDHVDKSGNFFYYDEGEVIYWMPIPEFPQDEKYDYDRAGDDAESEGDTGVDQDRGQ